MNEFLTNLKRQAQENPMFALAAGAAVITAVTKFLGAMVASHNSRVWAKEVARRAMKDALK
jgi:hypothetical protein